MCKPRHAVIIAVGALLFAPVPAQAYRVECRWAERVGFSTLPLGGDGATVTWAIGSSHRVRIQFGVFDDAQGPAPAGGLLAWNFGTLSTTSGINTRTPGRLVPFTFTPPNGNGLPLSDSFTVLTGIDAAHGEHEVPWVCMPDGQVPPVPPANIVGLNVFVSVYEFTTVVNSSNHVVAAGQLIVGQQWFMGANLPPDCGDPADPSDDVPGFAMYVPNRVSPSTQFSCSLDIVPAPGLAVIVGGGFLVMPRRRR